MTTLDARIRERLEREPFATSWYIHDLRNGTTIAGGAGGTPVAAGAGRLLLLVAFLDKVQRGTFKLSDPVVYEEKHRVGATQGIIQWLAPGKQLAIRDALAQSIITGDSVSVAMIEDYLSARGTSPEALITSFCSDAGIELGGFGESFIDAAVSVKDLVGLVDRLEGLRTGAADKNGFVIDASLAEEALRIMRSVLKTDGIAAVLPGHGPFLADVGHLPCDGGTAGKWSTDWADTGVVYRDGAARYSVSVTCNGVPEDIDGEPGPYRARSAIADVSYLLW